MGCGCGKKATVSRGTVPSQPLVFGSDNPEFPIRRVALLQASGGAPAGASRYVRGSEVNQMIADGILRPLDGK